MNEDDDRQRAWRPTVLWLLPQVVALIWNTVVISEVTEQQTYKEEYMPGAENIKPGIFFIAAQDGEVNTVWLINKTT